MPTKKRSFQPTSPLSSVRADTSIADCVRLMRDRNIGALVITSANAKEELVGIFTERDLVKQIELIHRGNFWDNPVRSVMTTNLRTITLDQVADAPKIMARYNIRHLPVVAEEKGRTRIIGVLSMRDIFRMAMETLDYDLDKVFTRDAAAPERKAKQKLVGVFSADRSIRELVDTASRMTPHLIVKAKAIKDDFDSLAEYGKKFEVLVVDLDEMSPIAIKKLLANFKASTAGAPAVYVVFSPTHLDAAVLSALRLLSEKGAIHLLAKPLALGLFFEHFLKEI